MAEYAPEQAIADLRDPARSLTPTDCDRIALCISKLCDRLAAASQRELIQDEAGDEVKAPAGADKTIRPLYSHDEKALATAQEIALMRGQSHSQLVSRIQVAVLDAMRWAASGVDSSDGGRP